MATWLAAGARWALRAVAPAARDVGAGISAGASAPPPWTRRLATSLDALDSQDPSQADAPTPPPPDSFQFVPGAAGAACQAVFRAAKRNDVQQGWSVLNKELAGGSAVPTAVRAALFTGLIAAHGRRGEREAALAALDAAVAEGLTLDPRPYEAAIKACAVLDAAMPNAVHVEPAWAAQGEAVYRRALTAGVPPGPGLFLAVLRCAAMARDSGMARRILEEWEAMLDAGAGVPRRTRPSRGHRAGVTRPGAAALTYVARALQPDAAAVGAAVTHFKETHGVDPPVPVWNAVLRCHAEADDVDGAFGVLQEMRAAGVRPDGGTCRVVAQAFQGNPSLAAELVAEVDAERRSGPAARAWPGRPRALAKPPWSFGPKLVVQRPGVGGAREVGEAGKATDSGNGGVDARADGGQGPAKRAPDVAPATLDAGPTPTDSPAADACPAIADAAPPSPTPVPTPSPTGGVLALELDLHGLSVPAGRAAVLNALAWLEAGPPPPPGGLVVIVGKSAAGRGVDAAAGEVLALAGLAAAPDPANPGRLTVPAIHLAAWRQRRHGERSRARVAALARTQAFVAGLGVSTAVGALWVVPQLGL